MNQNPEQIHQNVTQAESAEALFQKASKANEETVKNAQLNFDPSELEAACLSVYTKLENHEDQQACLYLGKSLGLEVDDKLFDPTLKEFEIADPVQELKPSNVLLG